MLADSVAAVRACEVPNAVALAEFTHPVAGAVAGAQLL